MRSGNSAALIFALVVGVMSSPVAAQEVRVVTSGGFTEAYRLLTPEFEARTGIKLITEYGASSGGAPDSIPERLKRGEAFDMVILARYALDDLAEAGYVFPGTRTDLVASKIGMSVRSGAPHPDISSGAAFVETLLSAQSIAYSASASGTYLAEDLFPRLGIWPQIEGKSVRVVSERVAAVVARGEAQIGFQQVSELLPIEGADFIGEIPTEYQQVTLFSAGITTNAQNGDGAMQLLEFLASEEAAPTIASTGLDPVVDD
nr:MAG: ABC transporter substrate-binding protein [Hyphomicrobiales bacterium]